MVIVNKLWMSRSFTERCMHVHVHLECMLAKHVRICMYVFVMYAWLLDSDESRFISPESLQLRAGSGLDRWLTWPMSRLGRVGRHLRQQVFTRQLGSDKKEKREGNREEKEAREIKSEKKPNLALLPQPGAASPTAFEDLTLPLKTSRFLQRPPKTSCYFPDAASSSHRLELLLLLLGWTTSFFSTGTQQLDYLFFFFCADGLSSCFSFFPTGLPSCFSFFCAVATFY